MRRTAWMVALPVMAWVSGLAAQLPESDVYEAPLRVEGGRLLVAVDVPSGETVDFVLGLARSRLTEWGAQRMGSDLDGASVGGARISFGDAEVVPDDRLLLDGVADRPIGGILGGQSLSGYDILIDAPGERLLLRRVGRSVRWEGVTLTNAVPLEILHDFLLRTDVEVNGEVFSAHLNLTTATMAVSSVVQERAGVEGGRADFRMGYSAFPDRPARFLDRPELRGWGGDDIGVVFVGAPVAYDCAIAISWAHAEMRTCVR